jgi:thymidylate kinase
LIIEALELQKSLADVEYAVTTPDPKALKSSSKGWRIPPEVTDEMIRVAASLISFEPSPRVGKFLVLSGVDKSGKETHAFNRSRLLKITSVYDHLVSLGCSVLPVSLPSYDTLLGSLVGAYLGRRQGGIAIRGKLSSSFAWLLWSLDRAQFNGAVDAWLASGPENVVLTKRWTESHLVYQPEVGVDYRRVVSFESKVVKQDFTVVLDIPPSEALHRLRKRSDKDNYEHASLIEKVRRRYLSLSEAYPYGDIYLVDASRSLEEVNGDLLRLVDQILRLKGNR